MITVKSALCWCLAGCSAAIAARAADAYLWGVFGFFVVVAVMLLAEALGDDS